MPDLGPNPHRRKPRECEVCAAAYIPTWFKQRTCGRACGVWLKGQQPKAPFCRVWFNTCRECATLFTARRRNKLICSADCKTRRKNRNTSQSIQRRYATDNAFRDTVLAAAHARRADRLGLGDSKITLTYLGNRDNWTCGICRLPIKDKGQASIDHIIPLSRGGTHTLNNVQVSHLACNYSKGNRERGEQLILVG